VIRSPFSSLPNENSVGGNEISTTPSISARLTMSFSALTAGCASYSSSSGSWTPHDRVNRGRGVTSLPIHQLKM
jgi:hypothetical protein